MKYIGVLVFAVALIWSWNLVHSPSQVSLETHSGIQQKLAELIYETIKTKKPNAQQIKIDRVWTEYVNPEKVKAFFTYSYQEDQVASSIRGEGVLERQKEDASGLDKWSLTQVKTTNDTIVFEEGLLVTPDSEPIAEPQEE